MYQLELKTDPGHGLPYKWTTVSFDDHASFHKAYWNAMSDRTILIVNIL